MDYQLSGQRAIVVGAAQGIGRRCAHALAKAGAIVTVADLNGDLAAATAAEIRAAGDAARAATVDIVDPAQCAELVAGAAESGVAPDLLVNCATLYRQAPALTQDPNEWARVIHVGLNGAFFLSQAFARAVEASGGTGRIVHLSSVSATHSMRDKAAYGAAKAGLDAMTKALAVEWGPHGIRVNAVAPSHVATETINELAASGALPLDQIVQRIPLGRIADPDEIADAVLFLASESARFITGQILAVDGGYTANGDWAVSPT